MTMTTVVTLAGGSGGPANAGEMSFRMFAKDGEDSYLGQHPTWVFPLSVHLARALQICWHIHLLHSSTHERLRTQLRACISPHLSNSRSMDRVSTAESYLHPLFVSKS
jgi:hypothetical protein